MRVRDKLTCQHCKSPMCVVAEIEVCYRSHTEKVSADHVKGGGKEWDTVKPLHKWFKHMHRVLLMDDDAYKVCTLPHLGRKCMSAYLNCAASATTKKLSFRNSAASAAGLLALWLNQILSDSCQHCWMVGLCTKGHRKFLLWYFSSSD